MVRRARRILFAGLTGIAGLSACAPVDPVRPVPVPPSRPAGLRPPPAAPTPAIARPAPAESRALAAYYGRVQNDLLVQGLLRTDGGGPDTAYDADDLVRNFIRIAFFDEYDRGAGFRPSRGGESRLKRWPGPVRIGVEFGDGVPRDNRVQDRNEVGAYARRLARISGHPIGIDDVNPNFHVLFMSETDRPALVERVRRIVPGINAETLDIFANLPRRIHCLVIAVSGRDGGYDYARAIALIRAEHPPLLRRSCIHEELAQGLGLANDSPAARPSIFNDDDEFALLTSHDEALLRMLYSPRLRTGMSLAEARPIIEDLAQEQIGGSG